MKKKKINGGKKEQRSKNKRLESNKGPHKK